MKKPEPPVTPKESEIDPSTRRGAPFPGRDSASKPDLAERGRIRVGNQTSAWAATPVEPFDYALAQGFDAFEWFPDKKPGAGWDDSDLDHNARQRICDTARAHDIRLSVHARWQANLLTPDSYPPIIED